MIDDLQRDARLVAAAERARPDISSEELLARVAWNVITEPGDGTAGALLAEFGAVSALRFALDDRLGPPAPSQDAIVRAVESVGDRPDDDVTSQGSSTTAALAEARRRWRPRALVQPVLDALTAAQDVSARIILPGDVEWPSGVDDLGPHAPTMLWVRGDPTTLTSGPRVSIVGARAASGYGEMLATEFAEDLARDGTVIVSGGAYGIDGAAHRGALRVGGRTVALLAGGVDRAYPQGHRELLRRIVDSGAVVSEVPCGAAPTKWRFLSRNRIIAALGLATVVVEAGWRSGSLNTAGHAAALGRPLGAVPGPVTSASSAGCHRLLREHDARCVTSSVEVRELWSFIDRPDPDRVNARDPDVVRMHDAMSSRTPISVGELARRSGLSPERVTGMLGLLELEGEAVRSDRGWRRTRERSR